MTQSIVCEHHGSQHVVFVCQHVAAMIGDQLTSVGANCLALVEGLGQDENAVWCGSCGKLLEHEDISFNAFDAEANLSGFCEKCLNAAKAISVRKKS
jgi:hypothetical protein